MLVNKADEFLHDWAMNFDGSGSLTILSEPAFDLDDIRYTNNKAIPHFFFDDGSVIVVFENHKKQTEYREYDSAEDLDREMDLKGNTPGYEYKVLNLAELER